MILQPVSVNTLEHYLQYINCFCKGNVDYTSGSYNVIFPAGITSASFDVSIIDDNILESNETFSLNIIHHLLPTKVTRGNPKTSTVTIVDDDSKCGIF